MSQTPEQTDDQRKRVLCLDDEAGVRAALRRELLDYEVEEAGSVEEARQVLAQISPDVVISDFRLPGEDGVSFLSWVADNHPRVVRILLTGYGDYQTSLRAINSGRVFALLEKPWSRDELLATVQAGIEVQHQNSERDALVAEFPATDEAAELAGYVPLLEGVAQLDAHKPGHAQRVGEMMESFGHYLKLSDARVQELKVAALAHELGELALPESCRQVPQQRLQGAQLDFFRQHPQRSAGVFDKVPALRTVARIVAAHHEHYDGSGFPEGLSGDAIPVPARLLAVVDTYDGARHGYLLPRALNEAQARQYLQALRGKQLDPRAVNAFLRWMQQQETPDEEQGGLPLDRLKPGMVLDRDLSTADGILLVPAGHRLTAPLIERIRALAKMESDTLRAVVRPA